MACAAGFSDSLVTSGGYDITLPPAESVWHSVDIDNLAVESADLRRGLHHHQ